LATNEVRGFAAQMTDCISAAFGDIPPEAHPPPPLRSTRNFEEQARSASFGFATLPWKL
jgi:hypothetical protein